MHNEIDSTCVKCTRSLSQSSGRELAEEAPGYIAVYGAQRNQSVNEKIRDGNVWLGLATAE